MKEINEEFFHRIATLKNGSGVPPELDAAVLAYARAANPARRRSGFFSAFRVVAAAAVAVLAVGTMWVMHDTAEPSAAPAVEYASLWDMEPLEEQSAEFVLETEYGANYMSGWASN